MESVRCCRQFLLRNCSSSIFCRHINNKTPVPIVEKTRRQRVHVHDYGYFFNLHSRDKRLPRLRSSMVPVKRPAMPKMESFDEQALMGQNDYIDILGDGSVHPADLLYHVPRWLRGFPGNQKANELVRLIHYRNMYAKKLKANMPKKYHDLVKRVNYLLKYHNYKKSDEIRLERKLGLWDNKPDYVYKEPWNERWHVDFKDNEY